MIAPDPAPTPHAPPAAADHPSATMPVGLPAAAAHGRRSLPAGEMIDLLTVPLAEGEDRQPPAGGVNATSIEEIVRRWVSGATGPSSPVTFVPLYGCHVAWTTCRAAVIGPLERLAQLEAAVLEFAGVEADLRDAERRAATLLETVEADVGRSLALDDHSPDRRAELAGRHREAVAVGRRLALLTPVVHAPPLHPPTLASQLGERLRERTRLVERHEFATQRAELAERVAEACGQRALEAGIARRQLGLEWAIVVLLVVQTVLLVVELLAQGPTP